MHESSCVEVERTPSNDFSFCVFLQEDVVYLRLVVSFRFDPKYVYLCEKEYDNSSSIAVELNFRLFL